MHTRLASLLLLSSMLACGGAPAKEPNAPQAAEPESDETLGSGSTTTEVAGDDQGTPLPEGEKGEPGRRIADIQAQVQEHRPRARACYDEAQSKTPSLEGDITVAWTIDPEGKITDVRVDPEASTLNDEGLGKCLVGVIQTLKFPSSAGGKETRARYPFNFHPKKKPSNTGY